MTDARFPNKIGYQ